MEMINKNMTIEEAIKQKPELVTYLSKVGIDFCCGGKRNLGEAIKDKGLQLDKIIKDMNEYKKVDLLNTNNPDKIINEAMKMSSNDLVDYIVEVHHRKEEELIVEVDRLLSKILKVHYEHHGMELSKIYKTFLTLKGELAEHFAKEEKIVFLEFKKEDKKSIAELENEHEAAGKLLEELELMTNNFKAPDDGCNTYKLAFSTLKELVDDIHMHIFIENSILFM